jgi:hypothetical protein
MSAISQMQRIWMMRLIATGATGCWVPLTWDIFYQWVKTEKFGGGDIPKPILTTVTRIATQAPNVEEAKKIYLYGQSWSLERDDARQIAAATPRAGRRSKNGWVPTRRSHCRNWWFRVFKWTTILWSHPMRKNISFGAEEAPIASLLAPSPFLWHATALDCIQDPTAVPAKITLAVGDGATVALASQKLGTSGADKVKIAVSQQHKLANVYTSSSLALNARTGESVIYSTCKSCQRKTFIREGAPLVKSTGRVFWPVRLRPEGAGLWPGRVEAAPGCWQLEGQGGQGRPQAARRGSLDGPVSAGGTMVGQAR